MASPLLGRRWQNQGPGPLERSHIMAGLCRGWSPGDPAGVVDATQGGQKGQVLSIFLPLDSSDSCWSHQAEPGNSLQGTEASSEDRNRSNDRRTSALWVCHTLFSGPDRNRPPLPGNWQCHSLSHELTEVLRGLSNLPKSPEKQQLISCSPGKHSVPLCMFPAPSIPPVCGVKRLWICAQEGHMSIYGRVLR
jgi:hypothetical protein